MIRRASVADLDAGGPPVGEDAPDSLLQYRDQGPGGFVVGLGDVQGRGQLALERRGRRHQVLDAVVHGYQEDFPVVDQDGTLVGIVTRDEIMTAAHSSDKFLTVRDLMKTDFPTVAPEDDLLGDGQRRLQESGMQALPVVRGGELVGMLTTEDIGQASTLRRYLGDS